ncbi:hypothetical protein RFI_14840 [Reticulomyxa filosa]|uniref:Uncharacterized protein n=1 Tax=Reticulomyxa filosa TaxID=46433 RepID=X6N7V1_RETFI|nr:hypothetical protein RFI_14840 [Reticulomyxa filosa]|eukprot:ETO22360.1 hypothetical protein RFI_14840 [Reticulomyxa filosa]
MVGSPGVLLQTAEQSLLHHAKRDDCQWALQLSDALLSLSNEKCLPTDEENDNATKITKEETVKAVEIGINALQCLASYMTSANGRNYYLTSAYELMNREKSLSIFGNKQDREWVSKVVPLEQLFQMLPVRFKADKMQSFNASLCFHFIDIKEFYLLIVRDGVVEVCLLFFFFHFFYLDMFLSNEKYDDTNSDILQKRCIDFANCVSELTSEAFRSLIAADAITGALMYSTGQVKIIKGSVFDFSSFRGYFQAHIPYKLAKNQCLSQICICFSFNSVFVYLLCFWFFLILGLIVVGFLTVYIFQRDCRLEISLHNSISFYASVTIFTSKVKYKRLTVSIAFERKYEEKKKPHPKIKNIFLKWKI